jgi:hypothetical protein
MFVMTKCCACVAPCTPLVRPRVYSGKLVQRVSAGSWAHTVLQSRSARFLLVASSREVTIRWAHSLLKYVAA